MSENWEDVVGYEGIYAVSDAGRVKRVAASQGATVGRILKPRHNINGYLVLGLCRDGKRKSVLVHRLVAEAFLGSAPSLDHEVNHKNGIKDDNRVENLEWVTRSENGKHSYRVLGEVPRRGEASGSAVLMEENVKEIRKLYATGEWTQVELGDVFGVAQTTISHIVTRRIWKHVP